MLRRALIGCALLAVIAALAGSPRSDPLGPPASDTEITQRVAGPATLASPHGRGTSTTPFLYQPCRTMTWVRCQAQPDQHE